MTHSPQQPDSFSSRKAISWYLQDLAKVPGLSLKAEQDLLEQIAADPHSPQASNARQRLIEANLRLVVCLARRYQPSGLELSDLIQEGNLALVKAAQQFDPRRSQHFRPFATRRICWALSRMVDKHLRERHVLEPEMEPIRPLRVQVLNALAHNAIDEDALAFDFPEERLVSLDSLLKEADTNAFLTDDRLLRHLSCCNGETPDEAYLVQERGACIADCLQRLTLKERFILTHRYLLDGAQSSEEIGKALGISRERVRQLEKQGIQKMRHPRCSRVLRALL